MNLADKQQLARILTDPTSLEGREMIWKVEEKVLTRGMFGLDDRDLYILSWILFHRNVMLTTHLRTMAAFSDDSPETEDGGDGASEPLVDGSGSFQ